MARPFSVSPVIQAIAVSYAPADLDAFNSVDVTLTNSTDQAIGNLRKNYPVVIWADALPAGMILSNAHCNAFGTLTFRLTNTTGTLITFSSTPITFNVVQR